MLGALALGETTVRGLLEGGDVLATAAALRALGAEVVLAGDSCSVATAEFRPASAMFRARLAWRSRPKACSLEVVCVTIAAVATVSTPMTMSDRTSAIPSCRAHRRRMCANREASGVLRRIH